MPDSFDQQPDIDLANSSDSLHFRDGVTHVRLQMDALGIGIFDDSTATLSDFLKLYPQLLMGAGQAFWVIPLAGSEPLGDAFEIATSPESVQLRRLTRAELESALASA